MHAQFFGVLGDVTIIGSDTLNVDAHALKEVGIHIYGVNSGNTSSNLPPTSVDDTSNLAQCLLISIFTSTGYGFHIFHRRNSTNFFIENYEAGEWSSWRKIPSTAI